MTDAKTAIKIIDSADYVIPYKTIRTMIKWGDDVEKDQFSQYSEDQWVWVNKERAKLKKAIRSRIQRGIFVRKYCPKGASQWYDSPSIHVVPGWDRTAGTVAIESSHRVVSHVSVNPATQRRDRGRSMAVITGGL